YSITDRSVVCDSTEIIGEVAIWPRPWMIHTCGIPNHSALVEPQYSGIPGADEMSPGAVMMCASVWHGGAYPDHRSGRLLEVSGHLNAWAEFVLVNTHLVHCKKAQQSASSHHIPTKRPGTCLS